MDHGIESKEERLAAGKSEKGKITLSAKTESGKVWISVTDNGTGLDREKIIEKARNRRKTAQICSQIGGKRSRRKLAHRLGRRLRTAHVFRRTVQNPYAIDGSNAFGRRSIVRHQIELWIAFALAQSLFVL